MEPIARYLDAAILKPDMTPEQVDKAIDECIALKTMTICVRGCDIDRALEKAARGHRARRSAACWTSPTAIPARRPSAPSAQGSTAARGVFEIDMVMNYGAARGGDWDDRWRRRVRGVVEEAHAKGVGREGHLRDQPAGRRSRFAAATEVSIAAGADFVKTSTGFNGAGATVEAVRIDAGHGGGPGRRSSPPAASAILPTAKKYVEMGAARLGVRLFQLRRDLLRRGRFHGELLNLTGGLNRDPDQRNVSDAG